MTPAAREHQNPVAVTALKKYPKLDKLDVHKDWGNARGFLSTCEVRDGYRGVTYFGLTNCNYIVFPSGLIVSNYGYHGKALMHRVRGEGVKKVEKYIRESRAKFRADLKAMGNPCPK